MYVCMYGRSLSTAHLPMEEMQGVFFKYGKDWSFTAPRQKAATSSIEKLN